MGESNQLVQAQDLAARLADPDWIVFDCRFNLLDPGAGKRAYDSGHIPGAVYASLDLDLASPRGPATGRHPLPDRQRFSAWVAAAGADSDRRVVAYDDMGGQFAARLWWLLRWIGHRKAALLDGGWQAWEAAGLPKSTERPAPRQAGTCLDRDDMPSVSTAEIESALGTDRWHILDARAPARFRGAEEPIDPVAGHVPGAHSAPSAALLAADGRFRRPAELREFFHARGVRADTRNVVTMCGSGVTGCHLVFALELAGLARGSLYAGSWSEWIRSPQRPVATGDP
ncbi:MAG: sulfurtransferase [Gammaproteobacteria bacterium]|nr:sulfurtransferase [Gammaproteobacteria bacterium]